MDKLLEPVLGALLFVAFIYLMIWTVKFFQFSMDLRRVRRAKNAQKKKESIKLRTIGCAKNYWYNKQDVEDRPEGRPMESYYHYFEKAEDCLKDLIIEMYDCGLVRTEMLEAIAYSGGMVGSEAKNFVQDLHNENVVSAKEEKAALMKAGADKSTIEIPVVDWDLEDILAEQMAEAAKREQAEAMAADEALKEAERILKKQEQMRDALFVTQTLKPVKRRTDAHKTAELGKARLEADKRNRLLKEKIEEEAMLEDEALEAEYAGILDGKGDAEKPAEPEKMQEDEIVTAALEAKVKHDRRHKKENKAKKQDSEISKEMQGMAEDALERAENELHEAEEEKEHLSKDLGPMTKEEKEAYEKDILIRTAVYESWVSYVFRLYELININANEEIRNEIRIALMEYGHNDVEVLLHSPE